MKIHTFGDSHSHEGWQHIENNKTFPIPIHVHLLGPKLMYTVGRDKLDVLNFKARGVEEGDIVICCFGEIDCRSHIYKFKHLGYKNVIDEIVDKYVDVIDLNKQQFNNLTVGIYNIVPPVRKEIIHSRPDWINKSFPHLGEDEERRDYVQYSNSCLKRKCEEYNYIFVDIYKEHEGEDGFIIHSDGNLHIGTPKFLEEFLTKHFIPFHKHPQQI